MALEESEWAAHAVILPLKHLFTFLTLLLGYQAMGYSLDLLNRPSDRAVYEGAIFLLLLGFFLPYALWRVWRSSL